MTINDAGSEAGMTLIELVLYLVLGVVVLVGVAQIFITGWQSDAATRDRDQATNEAQLAATSIQSSIRSSTEFDVTGNLLRATVATGENAWQCRAWFLTADERLLYHAQSSAIAVPTGDPGWTELATGVEGTLAGDVPFARDGSSANMLRLGFSVTHRDAVVPITGGAAAQAVGGAPSCW